jgi:hypothetical protein
MTNEDAVEDDYEVSAMQTATGAGSQMASERMSNQYDAETLNYLSSLGEPKVAEYLEDYVDAAPFFQQSVNALKSVIRTYICRETILANISNRELAVLNLEISLNEAVVAAVEHDTRQPEWLIVISLIQSAFDIMLTRATGRNRERVMQLNPNRVEMWAGKITEEESAQKKTRKLRGLFK